MRSRLPRLALLPLILTVLAFSAGLIGCSTGFVEQAFAGTTPRIATVAPSQTFFQYLDQALSPEVMGQMRSDRSRVLNSYPPGVNPLSTAQYGTRLLEGSVDLGDVFDARIPANALAFQTWAKDLGLVACSFPDDHVNIYSEAASEFLTEFQYDAVLFFPDEFHPVFTTPTDTWLFLREEPRPGGPTSDFHSSRITERKIALGGGFPMAPSPQPGLFYFYFPSTDQGYEPYRFLEGPESSFVPGNYTPITADETTLMKRLEDGHVVSPLSGRKSVLVGAWMSEQKAQKALLEGMVVREDRTIYTWSDIGLYLLALEEEFWTLPSGAQPSPDGGTLP